jgi:hypothetical protein
MMKAFHWTREDGHDGNDLERRLWIGVFGIQFALSHYTRAQQAPSGAPVGILNSFWIFTERKAFGWGITDEMVPARNLEIRLGDLPAIASETGSFEIHPALLIGRDDPCRATIQNRSDACANVGIRLYGLREGAPVVPFESWGVLTDDTLRIEAREQRSINLKRPSSHEHEKGWRVKRCKYWSLPAGRPVPWTRIHGRPEFLGS